MAVSPIQQVQPQTIAPQSGKQVATSSQQDFKSAFLKATGEAEQPSAAKPADQSEMTMEEMFQKASETYNVPVNLLKAMAKAESGFNPSAVSSAGAMGIMQLMPKTAKALGVVDPFDPLQNIMGGASYIGQKLEKYDGNIELALAAYNAGSGSVAKYGGVPPFKETQNYIKKIFGYMGQTFNLDNQQTNRITSSLATGTQEFKATDPTDPTILDLLNIYRQTALSALSIGQAPEDEDSSLF